MHWKTHTYRFEIKEHHLDSFGHTNHVTYFQFLEEARWQLMTDNGYGYPIIQNNKKGPVVLGIKVEFRRELLLRDAIQINTRVASYEKKIGLIVQDVLNGKQELCATAEVTFGFFDIVQRRLILPDSEWYRGIGGEAPKEG